MHATSLRQRGANARRDNLRKLSQQLVDTYNLIVLEDLKIRNMTRSTKSTLDVPRTNVAAKSRLNKNILDTGWSTLARMVQCKEESTSPEIVLTSTANTSHACYEYGYTAQGNRYGKVFACLACGRTARANPNTEKKRFRVRGELS